MIENPIVMCGFVGMTKNVVGKEIVERSYSEKLQIPWDVRLEISLMSHKPGLVEIDRRTINRMLVRIRQVVICVFFFTECCNAKYVLS